MTFSLDTHRLERIAALLEREIEQENIPGAVVAVGRGETTAYFECFGYAENANGRSRPMTKETVFDLASLTKVTATLPCILTLIDDGDIRLNDPVALFIPEFADAAKGVVTIRHLLTHCAGLVPSRQFYELFSTPQAIRAAIRREGMGITPDVRTEYSDIGFMLLGEVVEAVSGLALDQFASERVFTPLGMSDTMFCPPPSLFARIAATEYGKVGVVHDENAEALGGVSGHAGLFAPMTDLISYVSMWLGHKPLLSDAVRRLAVENHTPALNGNRGLGWVCRHDAYDHTGDLWPRTTVGHTGFTGTSMAFDPASGLWMIILTNDVHYGRQKKAIIRLRHRLHNLAASAIRWE
ncbi:beta-lactamase family protein [Alicyclobacillus fastidiosus]|uniref:Beta-lactamase family protein n=1 Tax=Alicyclobacillus fastidiosus TaxID=392011 RepID=A0ABY6ZJK6_9BACL|nr:serine hydrolase domain-containing protein [Alicyclobacillus fastidiosus]WAH43032.1 beta-lactamase family protein [Alicyclobacillus fastidiosus]GMA65011.1 serine hydrolase [Alicyclobacillus fastidiosus]